MLIIVDADCSCLTANSNTCLSTYSTAVLLPPPISWLASWACPLIHIILLVCVGHFKRGRTIDVVLRVATFEKVARQQGKRERENEDNATPFGQVCSSMQSLVAQWLPPLTSLPLARDDMVLLQVELDGELEAGE